MKNSLLSLSTLALFATLTSCSSTPNFGDQVRAEGGDVAKIGEQWQKGNKLVERGEDLISDGESAQKKGRKMVNTGEDLIQKGRRLMTDSKSTYNQRKAAALLQAPALPTAQ